MCCGPVSTNNTQVSLKMEHAIPEDPNHDGVIILCGMEETTLSHLG
jgi:hypothetical protein